MICKKDSSQNQNQNQNQKINKRRMDKIPSTIYISAILFSYTILLPFMQPASCTLRMNRHEVDDILTAKQSYRRRRTSKERSVKKYNKTPMCSTMIPPSYPPPTTSSCWQWWDPPPTTNTTLKTATILSRNTTTNSPTGRPKGCDYKACQEAVCACDLYCCTIAWDLSCRGFWLLNGNKVDNQFVNGCSASILCCETHPYQQGGSILIQSSSTQPSFLAATAPSPTMKERFSKAPNIKAFNINTSSDAFDNHKGSTSPSYAPSIGSNIFMPWKPVAVPQPVPIPSLSSSSSPTIADIPLDDENTSFAPHSIQYNATATNQNSTQLAPMQESNQNIQSINSKAPNPNPNTNQNSTQLAPMQESNPNIQSINSKAIKQQPIRIAGILILCATIMVFSCVCAIQNYQKCRNVLCFFCRGWCTVENEVSTEDGWITEEGVEGMLRDSGGVLFDSLCREEVSGTMGGDATL